MSFSSIFRVFFCIFYAWSLGYLSVHQQNELTQLRLQLPKIVHEIEAIEERTMRLKYTIDSFENPLHLMELMRLPRFRKLCHPCVEEIVILPVPPPAPPLEK